MKILVDTREQRPLDFAKCPDVQTEQATLTTGDYALYGFQNYVAIERKSESDLLTSLTRDRRRFEAELQRAKGMDFFAIVAETDWHRLGKGLYKSKAEPKSIVQSLFALCIRYGVHLFLVGTDRQAAAYTVHHLLRHYVQQKTQLLTAALMHYQRATEAPMTCETVTDDRL